MDSPTPHAGPPISFGRPTPAPAPAPVPASPVGDGARGLAVVVLVLSGLITAIDGGVVLASLPELHRVYTGDSSGESLLSLFDGLVVVLAVASVAVWISTALWLEAERARLGGHFRHGTAGTLWWWIVPIANLVKPFRVVEEVHRAAVPPSRQVWLGAWWGCWLGAGAAAVAANSAFATDGHGDTSLPVLALYAISAVLFVASYCFWVRIVWRTSRA